MSKRDNKRLERIRSLPCCCGCNRKAPSDAAHSNFSEHGKGRGIKADDYYTIPLARECHVSFDSYQMGMNREQSLEWFNAKHKWINEVLNDIEKDEAPIF